MCWPVSLCLRFLDSYILIVIALLVASNGMKMKVVIGRDWVPDSILLSWAWWRAALPGPTPPSRLAQSQPASVVGPRPSMTTTSRETKSTTRHQPGVMVWVEV